MEKSLVINVILYVLYDNSKRIIMIIKRNASNAF